jgi:hypothetical protein
VASGRASLSPWPASFVAAPRAGRFAPADPLRAARRAGEGAGTMIHHPWPRAPDGDGDRDGDGWRPIPGCSPTGPHEISLGVPSCVSINGCDERGGAVRSLRGPCLGALGGAGARGF